MVGGSEAFIETLIRLKSSDSRMWMWPSAALTMAATTSSVGGRTPAPSLGRPGSEPALTPISAAPPMTTLPTRTGTDLRRGFMASSQQIVICHQADQTKQKSKTDVMDHLFPSGIDRPAADQFQHQEGGAPTIQGGERQDVRQPQAEAQQRDHRDQ